MPRAAWAMSELAQQQRLSRSPVNAMKKHCNVFSLFLGQPTCRGSGCDLHIHRCLLVSWRTPVPAGIFQLQLLYGYSESPGSVITDGHWSVFVAPFSTCQQTGPIPTPTPLLLTFSVDKQSQGSQWRLTVHQSLVWIEGPRHVTMFLRFIAV